MNVSVNSPLEGILFNYSNFHFLTLLNNLWTWFAAISLGKIHRPKPELLHLPDSRALPESDPAHEVLESDAVTVSEPACVPTLVLDGNGSADVDGVTKGKFTVYYEDVRECGNDDVLNVTQRWEEREGKSNGCESEWWESWERMLRLKNGENENGWYTCQDLTALNGNVLRLWDGEFR